MERLMLRFFVFNASLSIWRIMVCNGVTLPNFFSSGMVLQRDEELDFWGTSTCFVVEMRLGTLKYSGMVNDDRTWKISIPSQVASMGNMIYFEDCEGNVSFSDLSFGDVFLCSGQSNMEFSVYNSFGGEDEVSESAKYTHLRFATVARNKQEQAPFDLPQRPLNGSWWHKSDPSSFSRDSFSYPSAVCYYTAISVYNYFKGTIPVGFIGSYWGGQKIQPFSSSKTITECTGAVTKQDGELFDGMIAPLLGLKFKSILWYQGEANEKEADLYKCFFPSMITDWRTRLQQPNITFGFVQLAGFGNQDFVNIRQAQMSALDLNNVGCAVAIDIGDKNDIHPREKREVGRRLSLSVLKMGYGVSNIASITGPMLSHVSVEGPHLKVSFVEGTAIGLHLNGTLGCTTCCNELPFEYQINDHWVRVSSMVIQKDEVILNGAGLAVRLRYNYEPYPECSLASNFEPNIAGKLPTVPFETQVKQISMIDNDIWTES